MLDNHFPRGLKSSCNDVIRNKTKRIKKRVFWQHSDMQTLKHLLTTVALCNLLEGGGGGQILFHSHCAGFFN